jgi:hypothetical protein
LSQQQRTSGQAEVADVDDIAALMARSKAALEEFTANRHWRAPTGALLKKVWNAEYRELRRAFEGSVEWLNSSMRFLVRYAARANVFRMSA